MTATAHILVGAALASSFHNPAVGIALAASSHPLLDLVPHWDFGWGWKTKSKRKLFLESLADLGLGIALAYFIFGSTVPFWYLAAAAFASVSWDLLETPYWFFHFKKAPVSWIYKFQSNIQGKAALPWGILSQIVTVLITVLVLQAVRF